MTTTTTTATATTSKTPKALDNNNNNNITNSSTTSQPVVEVAIVGGGIVGLTLALCLHKYCVVGGDDDDSSSSSSSSSSSRIRPILYEQAPSYEPDVGAGMGLYANGLRVIRDLSPDLLQELQSMGCPYQVRRYERHDGTLIATGRESVLGSTTTTTTTTANHGNDNGNGNGNGTLGQQEQEQEQLQTMGIRRWKLQQALHRAVQKAGITIEFNKQVEAVEFVNDKSDVTCVKFTDGTLVHARLLVGADGGKSKVRSCMLEHLQRQQQSNHNNNNNNNNNSSSSSSSSSSNNRNQNQQNGSSIPKLEYTGVTCIMGVAENLPLVEPGISLPVSETTKCHGAFYPTGPHEQCFQFHFPVAPPPPTTTNTNTSASTSPSSCTGKKETTLSSYNNNNKIKNNGFCCQEQKQQQEDSCWGNLSQRVSQQECSKLAKLLEADGWDETKFLAPLRNVTNAVRVGYCTLTPPLKEWSFANTNATTTTTGRANRTVILVGDAAHPPVPYTGQGAQLGLEDAATLALLLSEFCCGGRDNHDNDDGGGNDKNSNLDESKHRSHVLNLSNLNQAVQIYEQIRIPRVESILGNAHFWGHQQQKRAEHKAYNIIKEEMIQRDVFFHEITPILFDGANYDYRQELNQMLSKLKQEHKMPAMSTIAEGT